MIRNFPEPAWPTEVTRPHTEPHERPRHQFRIVARYAVICSCGAEIKNPDTGVRRDDMSPWFLRSNDARGVARRHHQDSH